MSLTRRQALQWGAAAAVAPVRAFGAEQGAVAAAARPRVRLAVSSYSYWHFKTEKYPIESVMEHAATLGFDGVEILHRQMADESPGYLSGLKKAAFRNSLDLVMLSIHQDFVSPEPAERRKEVEHTPGTASTWPPSSGSRASASTRAGGTPSAPSTTS